MPDRPLPSNAAPSLPMPAQQRLREIDQARRAVMFEGRALSELALTAWPQRPWLERSWQRCLAMGQQPGDAVAFNLVTESMRRRAAEHSRTLVQAAQATLQKLARAIANTRYFAILTDAQGIVVDTHGPIDHSDRRAHAIARVGVDLSERSVGTTAIGAALAEQTPVWLHRGEHFFEATSVYSCAGAPLFGPDGRCVGMLDLTGIEAQERPELQHLALQSARSIENAMVIAQPHALLLRLNWPGHPLGSDADALVALDADGWVVGINSVARQTVASLAGGLCSGIPPRPVHASDVFAMPWEGLFDAVRQGQPLEVPMWSGLRLHALPQRAGDPAAAGAALTPSARVPLKDIEVELIRKAVRDAQGNVMEAARRLGISRATIYRKLGNPGVLKPRKSGTR